MGEIAIYFAHDVGYGDVCTMTKELQKFVSGWVNKAVEAQSKDTKTPLDKL